MKIDRKENTFLSQVYVFISHSADKGISIDNSKLTYAHLNRRSINSVDT